MELTVELSATCKKRLSIWFEGTSYNSKRIPEVTCGRMYIDLQKLHSSCIIKGDYPFVIYDL